VAHTGRFLTAEWRWLAMANYAVDPALLRPRVPAGLELDLFERVALVSLVGFRFLRTRLLGVAVPFHRDFDEVNLRFYVRRRVDGGLEARSRLRPRARCPAGPRHDGTGRLRGAVLGCPDGAHEDGRRAQYRWRWKGSWRELAMETAAAGQIAAPGWAFRTEGSEITVRRPVLLES